MAEPPGSTTTPAIAVEQVTKTYGRFTAVDNISFTIQPGETVGLFGPNGAGKTTILRMLAGLTHPTDGTISFSGTEVRPDNPAIYHRIGVVTHESMLYDELTARENLRFHARLHGVDDIQERCEAVLETIGLTRRASHRPDGFSHGLRKRLSLARALLHDPAVLLLDEPYSGLDQRAAANLSTVLDTLVDRTIVLTTHNLKLGRERCSRALIVTHGSLQTDLSTRSLSRTEFESTYQKSTKISEDNHTEDMNP